MNNTIKSAVKSCAFCGAVFIREANNQKYCSRECAKGAKRASMREYLSRPEVKERYREYRSRPEAKERQREHQRKYKSRPEVKEREREYLREYRSRPEVKAKDMIRRRENKNKQATNFFKLQHAATKLGKLNEPTDDK